MPDGEGAKAREEEDIANRTARFWSPMIFTESQRAAHPFTVLSHACKCILYDCTTYFLSACPLACLSACLPRYLRANELEAQRVGEVERSRRLGERDCGLYFIYPVPIE